MKKLLMVLPLIGALVATPAMASNPWPLVGGILGGIIIGGAIAHSHERHPDNYYYYDPDYGAYRYRPTRRCLWEPTYDVYNRYVGDRLICRVR